MKDYATSLIIVGPSPSDSGTTLTVKPGHGARFGDAPFKATIHPKDSMPELDNAEKVLVTAKDGDTFTIERGLSPTTPKYIQAGDRITGALFAEDFDAVYDAAMQPGPEGQPGPAGGPGPKGEMGVGVPSGGITNQVLTKNSASNYDFVWRTPEGAGDMLRALYDPAMGLRQVAFADQLSEAGTTNHSALDNLNADDHPQYLNNTRGDARYFVKQTVTDYLAGKANTSHTHTIENVTGLQTAIDAKESTSNKSTNVALGTSDTLYPTQKAVKTYVDGRTTGNADTVDGYHASATPTANTIPVLNASGKLPASTSSDRTLAYSALSGGPTTFAAYAGNQLSITITTDGTEYVWLRAYVGHGSTNASTNFAEIKVLEGATTVAIGSGAVGWPGLDGMSGQSIISERIQPTAGTHTYTLSIASARNNTTHSIYPDSPAYLMAERA